MSKSKGAAKAAPAKKAAPKKGQAVAVVEEPIEEVAADWPPGLVETEVETFFNAIESGDHTVKTAAKFMGRKGQEVYRWARTYPRFAKRLEEAIDIGCLMAEDSYRSITASDRDSAAGANIAFTGIDRYLKVKRPRIYNTGTFKPVDDNNDTQMIVGVVLVPQRSDDAGHVQQRAAIEGSATHVTRLPIEQAPAPAFTVKSDG